MYDDPENCLVVGRVKKVIEGCKGEDKQPPNLKNVEWKSSK